jgi:GNAT superfamily N-acetyltransferase
MIRPATQSDLPRIHEIRHGTAENRLADPSRVTSEEVAWYMQHAIFLLSEDARAPQGFVAANPQTGYIWALFVIDAAHNQGHGTALLAAALEKLRAAGNRQAFLTTGAGTKAETFYRARGWHRSGHALNGEAVYRMWL